MDIQTLLAKTFKAGPRSIQLLQCLLLFLLFYATVMDGFSFAISELKISINYLNQLIYIHIYIYIQQMKSANFLAPKNNTELAIEYLIYVIK